MNRLFTIAVLPAFLLFCVGCQASQPASPPAPDSPAAVLPGPRPVEPTPLALGTLFAAPDGASGACSETAPCALETALERLKPGSVLFLRGGVYPVRGNELRTRGRSGTAEAPIVIESYPGEWAVLEGEFRDEATIRDHHRYHYGFRIDRGSNHVHLRRLEVRYMGGSGVGVHGSHNLVEGVVTHHNVLSGIEVYGGEWREDDPDFVLPYPEGFNVIRDNVSHHNSDVFIESQGDNADGISVSSGRFNRIEHNRVYANSDDGIDTWRSNDSYVAYNLVSDNGRGPRGNGSGIKAGGNNNPDAGNGRRTVVEHNLAWDNRARGFDYNAGRNVLFRYNTAFRNAAAGFTGDGDTRLLRNIAYQSGPPLRGRGQQRENSWQLEGAPRFLSLDPGSPDFLKPVPGSAFAALGAYAAHPPADRRLFVIGDSTVHNPDEEGSGWGDRLGEVAAHPDLVTNRARSGASSKSYKDERRRPNWRETRAELAEKARPGDFLLIQFGHNDEHEDDPEACTEPGRGGSYYRELAVYVREARALGLVPVLVTPVERMYPGRRTHGAYPETVRQLAADTGALLLDLSEKSYAEFAAYPDDAALVAAFGYKDHTHFSPAGALAVAGWVRELACQAAEELCLQFR